MAGFNLGDIFVTFKAKTDDLDGAVNKVRNKMNEVDENTKKVNSSLGKTGVIIGAVAGVVQSAFNKAVQTVSNTIGTAIKRVDTLNNSARSFANMGFQTDAVKRAMDGLDKSIRGLPTSLDGAVRGMTLIAAATNDVEKSQKIWSALNDGILGFGGSTQMVDNATVQLSQDLAGGRLQAETWNSLLDSGLGPTLSAIARQMGLTTRSLKEGLSDGTISIDTFTDALIKMDNEGGGGMKSLKQIAKDSTAGIATGVENAQTAISRGIASIIETVGSANIADVISKIGSAAEGALKTVSSGIKFIAENKDIFIPIAVGISAIVAAMAAWNAINLIVAASQAILNAVLAANPIAIIILAVIGLIAGLTYFFTQTETGKKIMESFFKIVADGFAGFQGWIGDAQRNIGNFVNGIVGFFRDLPGNIGRAIASVGNFITAPFRNAFNFISDAWNNTVGKLSWKVPSWVPGIGGNSIGAPKLPRFSTGVENFAGGLAYVHGGEVLANLAPGTSVIPKNKVSDMMNGGGVKVYGDVNIDSKQDADYFFNRYTRNNALEGMGLSPAMP